MAMLIGLSGFAGSGKSTIASVLIAELDFERVKFADPLKNMFRTMLRDMGHSPEEVERYVEGDLKSSKIDGLGSIQITSRDFQVGLGTAFGRKVIHPDFWVNLWATRVDAARGRTIADDMRFVNEEAKIRGLGGLTIQVRRKGTGPAAFKWKRLGPWLYRRFGIMWGVHDSERIDRLRPDIIIENDGSIADLHKSLATALRKALSCA